ncbi:MAG: hypothetical protein KAQ71_10060, partial [Desulfobulbaceae bacterium]|nr:hypothetical protein [Desulfobulbaceae bacterium]
MTACVYSMEAIDRSPAGSCQWTEEMSIDRQTANIFFVCTGNICRSPFAQGLFTKSVAQKGSKGLTADSAGLLALPGNSATYMAQRVAVEYGVDLSDHKAKFVSK